MEDFLSTSARAASQDLSRRTCHAASVLHSSWLFCWASELNSASRWQPKAPSNASLCDALCSEDPVSSREVRTAPPLPQERLPRQPSEPDEYFNKNGTKSRLSLSLGLIFFYKTKQRGLARLRAGCNSIPSL